MLVVAFIFLWADLSIASAAPVVEAPTTYSAATFTTPFMGFDVVETALSDEQALAAEMQGLVQVSPAQMLRAKNGADVAFAQAAPVELNFQPFVWANPSTFAIYRFDRELWQKSEVTEQTLIERGVYTARGKILRNGTFAVFAEQPDYRISNANLISFKFRTRIVKMVSVRSADSDGWYRQKGLEAVERLQFDVATPLPLIHWVRERTIKLNFDSAGSSLKLEQRDGQVFMLQRVGRNGADWKEIATPVHILAGSWNEYLSGGKITIELIDDSVGRIVAPKYAPASWEVPLIQKAQSLLGFELVRFELAPDRIIRRGRLNFDPSSCEQYGGVRGSDSIFWVRARGKWSVWNLLSTPISIWAKLFAVIGTLIILAPIVFVIRRIKARMRLKRN